MAKMTKFSRGMRMGTGTLHGRWKQGVFVDMVKDLEAEICPLGKDKPPPNGLYCREMCRMAWKNPSAEAVAITCPSHYQQFYMYGNAKSTSYRHHDRR